jgi:hypothetical protein
VPGVDNHWGIYVNDPDNNLRFWQGDNKITFTDDGELIIADHDTPFATLSIDKGTDPVNFEMRGSSKRFGVSLSAALQTTFYSDAFYKFVQDGTTVFNLSSFDSNINSELAINSQDNPNYSLDVDSGNNSAIININDDIDPVSVWTGLRLERDNTEKWFVGMDSVSDHLFFRNNAAENFMTISNTGNVAIGAIANPGAKLEVDGNIMANDPIIGAHLATKNYVDAQAGGNTPKFYVTNAYVDGSDADTACAAGYHMCMPAEWFGKTYDFVNGNTWEWGRSWYNSTLNLDSCEHWTSNAANRYGLTAFPDTSNSGTTGWQTVSTNLCNVSRTVLCCSD